MVQSRQFKKLSRKLRNGLMSTCKKHNKIKQLKVSLIEFFVFFYNKIYLKIMEENFKDASLNTYLLLKEA